jgi:toxin FitB
VAGVQGSPVDGYLLDTSAVVHGQWPPHGDLAISVVTLGELQSGILVANDPVTRAHRNRRYRRALELFVAYDVDMYTAERYGAIHAAARLAGRIKDKADHLIMATAAEHGLTLYTRDERQAKLAEDLGLLVEYAS